MNRITNYNDNIKVMLHAGKIKSYARMLKTKI